ncbi:MAG: hypothetical protein JO108_00275 [Acidobacteriaceae bacterium]|nr:hypothetical protein [Acidobacteriaceae bacterium]
MGRPPTLMNAEGEEPLLKDVIDAHVHCDPDSIARDIDAVDLARLAKRLGMRGFVMKNHFEPTASVAISGPKGGAGHRGVWRHQSQSGSRRD